METRSDGNWVFAANEAEAASLERSSFISKVYGLLSLSLLAAVAGATAGVAMGLGPKAYWWLAALEFVALFFAYSARHDEGKNLLALFAFTGTTGLSLSCLLTGLIKAGFGSTVWLALALTFGIFVVLSLYVRVSGKDFSFMRGFLFTGLLVLCAAAVISVFFPGIFPFQGVVMASLGVILFSGFILYDTSRILHKGTKDYIDATISLYLDLLNIFVDVLRLLVENAP